MVGVEEGVELKAGGDTWAWARRGILRLHFWPKTLRDRSAGGNTSSNSDNNLAVTMRLKCNGKNVDSPSNEPQDMGRRLSDGFRSGLSEALRRQFSRLDKLNIDRSPAKFGSTRKKSMCLSSSDLPRLPTHLLFRESSAGGGGGGSGGISKQSNRNQLQRRPITCTVQPLIQVVQPVNMTASLLAFVL